MRFVLDVTRLVGSDPLAAPPTGIARVELAYIDRFLPHPRTLFVRTTRRMGLRRVHRSEVETLVSRIAARWSVEADPAPELAGIEQRLAESFGLTRIAAFRQAAAEGDSAAQRLRSHGARAVQLVEGFSRAALGGNPGIEGLGAHDVYFHVSHQATDEPHRFRALERSRLRKVFACHDLIPITYPEYVEPGAREKHCARIATVTRLADLVYVISRTTKDDLIAHIEREGLRRPPIVVAPLGLEPTWFREVPVLRAFEAPAPYFLAVSTIEARKNHAFLLRLWRELVTAHGDAAPILLIVGKRGWQVQSASALLDRCLGFDGHVHELGTVSDAALRVLMGNAAGLLAPSFTEGFSYPPIEAMLAGRPILASDIGAHREYLTGAARFIAPSDGEGWKRAVMELAVDGSAAPRLTADERRRRAAAVSWDAHFSILADALDADGPLT